MLDPRLLEAMQVYVSMSVLEAGLRLSTGPLPTSPRPLPLTQMKVGAGLESASQVRVTLSRPSLTGDEAELLTVALGGTETETDNQRLPGSGDGRQQSWIKLEQKLYKCFNNLNLLKL